MNRVKIGDVCEVMNGFAFKSEAYVDSGIRIIRIANVQKGYIEDSSPVFYPIGTSGISRYMLEEGDLLLSLTGNVGRVAILEKELLPAALNQRVACLRVKEDTISKGYLFHILNSDFFEQKCIHSSKGVAQKNMSSEWLKEFEIPLYTKEKQELITEILDRLSSIIRHRKLELRKLDEVIRARFVELFGDPFRNTKGWKVLRLSDCLTRIDNGKSFTCDNTPREGLFPAILKLSAATYGDYRPSENKALFDESQFVEAAEVHAGDLLFTRKNTPELVGMAAYVYETPEKLMMPDLIFRLVTNERMNPVFLWQLMNNREFRPVIQSISGGSAKSMSNISKERLGSIEVICPPITEQNKIEEILKQVNKSRFYKVTIEGSAII